MNQHDPTVYATGGNVTQRGSLAAPNITADYVASLVAERDRLRGAFEEYASHASWRCGHPDRYPWEPDCPCGLTKACREFGVETHND